MRAKLTGALGRSYHRTYGDVVRRFFRIDIDIARKASGFLRWAADRNSKFAKYGRYDRFMFACESYRLNIRNNFPSRGRRILTGILGKSRIKEMTVLGT